jgi:hypothetical protein
MDADGSNLYRITTATLSAFTGARPRAFWRPIAVGRSS